MRVVRVTIGTLFAATLLTVCIGLQVLEATGRWDRTLQDTGDEAIIVAVVLCIGAALVAVRATREPVSLSPIRSSLLVIRPASLPSCDLRIAGSAFSVSPPISLRI